MIAYPYATDETGEIVHISDAEKDHSYHCTGCNKPMVCRQGEKREWHFAHKAAQGGCSWESVLHKQAKHLIERSFKFAQKNEQPYFIHLSCDTCENNYISGDIASSCSDVILEKSVVDNTRSDIVFIRKNSNCYLIIEVVVEHALEQETEARYKAAGHPVFILELDDFCQLKELEKQIVIPKALNTKTKICEKCKEKEKREKQRQEMKEKRERQRQLIEAEKEKQRQLIEAEKEKQRLFREEKWERQRLFREERRKKLRQLVETELHRLNTRIPAESKKLYRWEIDKYGSPMSLSKQEKVFANAIILCDLGFRQYNLQEPWNFSFDTRWGTIHAHLGPIWEGTACLLDGIGADEQSSELQKFVFDVAYKKIEAAGVELRRIFISE